MDLELLSIPTAKLNQFKNCGINTVEDLAKYIPKKYIDFRNKCLIKNLEDNKVVAVVAKVINIYKSDKSVSVMIKDESNEIMFVSWFNMPYMYKKIEVGREYFFGGKVKVELTDKGIKRSMVNPTLFSQDIKKNLTIFPVYKRIRCKNEKTGKITYMSDSYLKECIQSAITLMDKDDYLESSVLNKFKLLKIGECLRKIHNPKNIDDYKKAKTRLIFDDLFFFNLKLLDMQNYSNTTSSFIMDKYELVNKFIKTLPFKLTEGQKNVCHAIFKKIKSGQTLNALIQGDVGTGKTIVAIIALLTAIDSGYQGVLMTPTLILAKQHYEEIQERCKILDINIALLTGETKTKERKSILKGLKDGTINLVVSTHAITSKQIEFHNLGMIIVDEEHKFGVLQRDFLKNNNKNGIHSISLSATPIPRSLSMALYGNSMDILTINTKPKNRKEVITKIITNKNKSYEFIRNEIHNGRQCYIVCPYIDKNEDNINSIEDTYKEIVEYFKDDKKIKPIVITGKMNKDESSKAIKSFSNNETNILISTTIIEVGVNVPNATIMLIKNSERFGLSQLHQLRGRVGRGKYQSYCLLETKSQDERLKVMCETTDGFIIAEKDLLLRGTGDFIGTKQSGNNKYVMLMLGYKKYNQLIRDEIIEIYKNKNRLKHYLYLLLEKFD